MKIFIGVPCYENVTPEVYDDHCRFWFHLGRRYPEHEFFWGVKTKTEQFRARNAIVTGALQVGADYLLMVDDDMVFDWEKTQSPSARFEFLRKMLCHFDANPDAGIVGALYYQRGSECAPVMMRETSRGDYCFMHDHEIEHKLQEVAVAGGGCILIKTEIFDKIKEPYFEPEFDIGTDIQICKKARDCGYKVYVDTSIEIGHVMPQRTIVTSKNRHTVYADTQEQIAAEFSRWHVQGPINEYLLDAQKYLGLDWTTIEEKAILYRDDHFKNFEPTPEYYRSLGEDQLCRQICYHATNDFALNMMEMCFKIMAPRKTDVLDFACGSAPIGFELANLGNNMTFVDLDGASGFEFLKWRINDRGLHADCFDSSEFIERVKSGGMKQFNVIILMDALEHFVNWEEIVDVIAACLKNDGAILTNYLMLADDPENVEHVSMDKDAVLKRFTNHSIYPMNKAVLIKTKIPT